MQPTEFNQTTDMAEAAANLEYPMNESDMKN